MQRKSAENENPKCLMVHAICWCRLALAMSHSWQHLRFQTMKCIFIAVCCGAWQCRSFVSSICVSSLINGDVDNGTRSWSQQNVTCCYQTICELLERWKGKMARTCDQGEETQSGTETVQRKECLRLEVFFPLNLTHCVPIRAPF